MSEQENNNLRSVSISTKQNMPISMGSFEYIAGIDPKETWAPVSKDDMDVEEFEKTPCKAYGDYQRERVHKRVSGFAERYDAGIT